MSCRRQDVMSLMRKLAKVKDVDANTERLVDVLQQLSQLPMTLSILKKTKVGHSVNKLRKHECYAVQHLAKTLVKKWKAIAQANWQKPNTKLAKSTKYTPRVSNQERPMVNEGELPSSPPNTVIPDKQGYSNFGSGMKNGANQLSNLFAHTIVVDGKVYPSAEHAYQSRKFEGQEKRFETGGDLTKWSAMGLFVKEDKKESKIAYWGKKRMIGIIAKMATNPQHNRKTRLPQKTKVRQDIFEDILRNKFKKGSPLRPLLLATGEKYLVEFDRGAKRMETHPTKPRRSRWAGLAEPVDKDDLKKGYKLYGDNRMGLLLMKIRDEIRKEPADSTLGET